MSAGAARQTAMSAGAARQAAMSAGAAHQARPCVPTSLRTATTCRRQRPWMGRVMPVGLRSTRVWASAGPHGPRGSGLREGDAGVGQAGGVELAAGADEGLDVVGHVPYVHVHA